MTTFIMIPHVRFRWLQRGFLVLGLLILGLWSRTWLESRSFQSAESRKLEAALRAAISRSSNKDGPGSAALAGLPASAAPKHAEREGILGRIEIPRLRIAAIVAEGSDLKTLKHAVGHIPSTAAPGRPGNCALAGHRDTFFRGLGGVRVNDVIRIVTLERTYTYEVLWTSVVEPRRVDVLNPTDARSLTLITCYPFAFIGHAPKRFIVRARQVEAAAERGVSEDPGAPAANPENRLRQDESTTAVSATGTAMRDRGLQPHGHTAGGR